MERVSTGHAGIGVCSLQANVAGSGQILLVKWPCNILRRFRS